MRLEDRLYAANTLVSILDAGGAREFATIAATEFLMSLANDDFWNPRYQHYLEITRNYLRNSRDYPAKIEYLREDLADLERKLPDLADYPA